MQVSLVPLHLEKIYVAPACQADVVVAISILLSLDNVFDEVLVQVTGQ